MTESPKLQMIGEADSQVCEDDLCQVPQTTNVPEPPR
jgi:hypothetical protein